MSKPSSGSPGSKSSRSDFVPPSVEELDAVLSAYEFLDILGRGGMGAVYKARQINLDRIVAIKIMPQSGENDEMRFDERFQREAQAMARLSHRNIVAVYDFGRTRDGQLYIVMEYVEGTDLQQAIATGQITVEHLFGWVPQICDALQYAHGQGIVHRDIKPANIIINREGTVKVADFGLAKLSGAADAHQTRLTMTNMVMGTPDYVAPEALEEGVEPDHRADLYAVGVMLYVMLTGKVPRGAWRSPTALKPDLDPRFDGLVNRAMDADRDSRFQHATEISSLLTLIQTTPRASQISTPVGRKLNLAPVSGGAAGGKGSISTVRSSGLIPTAPAVSAQPPRSSNTALIVGGSVAAAVAIAALATIVIFGIGKIPDEDLLSLAGDPVSDIAPVSAPENPAAKGPALKPEPEPEPPKKMANVPAPEPDPAPEPLPKPEPVVADASGPLLPARQSIFVDNLQGRGIEIPSLTANTDEPFTAEAWIYPLNDQPPQSNILGFGKILLRFEGDKWGIWRHRGFTGPAWERGRATHAAMVVDDSLVTLFVDGKPTASGEIPATTAADLQHPASIGGGWYGDGGFRGRIDEVRFSNVARYTEEFTPSRFHEADENTLALYHFDQTSDGKIIDASGNGHDIPVSNRFSLNEESPAAPPLAQAPFDAATALERQRQWADFYGVPMEYENLIGMKLRLLPPGRFLGGHSNNSDTSVPAPFYIGVHEVTQAEYAEIMGENPSSFREGGNNAAQVAGLDALRHPVENVAFLQAAEFCNRLSERDGFTPAYRIENESLTGIEGADGYRLPTGEEWEYACRAGTITSFLDGNPQFNFETMGSFAWVDQNSDSRTHPSGGKLPNPFGLHDVQGNVREWANGNKVSEWKVMEPIRRLGGFRRDASQQSWASWKALPFGPAASDDLGFRVVLPGLAAVAALPADREIERVTPPHPAALQLTAIEKEIRDTHARRVEAPSAEALRKLNEQFRNALTQRAAAALENVRPLFDVELGRLDRGDPMPSADDGLPQAITQLRQTWRQQEALLAENHRAALGPFWESESAKLQQAVVGFEREGLTYFASHGSALLDRLQAEFLGESSAERLPASIPTDETPPPVTDAEGEWIPLFDTRTLDGWTATGTSRVFTVERDTIRVSGGPGFLYYTGSVAHGGRFRDFDLRCEVKTTGNANTGVFFHTADSGRAGFPEQGHEVQIHNGTADSSKTGGLSDILPLTRSTVSEDEWFTLELSVRGQTATIKINGETTTTHTEDGNYQPPGNFPRRRLSEGTLALQSHLPESGVAWFRNLEVRPYIDPLTTLVALQPGTSIERHPPHSEGLPKGRLFAWGIDHMDEQIDLGGSSRGNDFVRVFSTGSNNRSNYYALRSRGTLESWGSDRWDNSRGGIAGFSPPTAGVHPFALKQDGHIDDRSRLGGIHPRLEQGAVIDFSAGTYSAVFLHTDGRIAGFGRAVGEEGGQLPPAGPTDIVAISQWAHTCWALRENGRVLWFGRQPSPELPSELNQNIFKVVSSPALNHSLALTKDGHVFAWGTPTDLGYLDVPASARNGMQDIRVAETGGLCTARQESGKWIAWGNDKFGVVSKINELGPGVVDLAFTDRFLLWIE